MASSHFQEAFRRAMAESERARDRRGRSWLPAMPLLLGLASGGLLAACLAPEGEAALPRLLALGFALLLIDRFGMRALLTVLAGFALILATRTEGGVLPLLWPARDELGLGFAASILLALRQRAREVRRLIADERTTAQGHRHRLLNSLLMINQDCLALLDRHGRLLAINQAGVALMQFESAEQPLGRSWLEAWPEPKRGEARQLLQAALDGEGQRVEADCPTARGELRRWDVQLLPVHGPDDSVPAVLVIGRDISALAESARQARDSGEAYAELLRRIDDAFIALDSDWRVVFANKEADDTLHNEQGGLVGREFWQVFSELNGSEFQLQCLESLHDGHSRRFQFFLARHSVWLSVAVYPSRQGVALLLRDVTDQVRASAQIERHRARLRLAQDIAGFGDWEYDVLQGRLELGETSCKLLGVDPAEAAQHGQRALLDAVEDDQRNEVLSHLLSRIASRRPIDIRFRTLPDRPCGHLRLRGQIMADEAGRPRHVVGTLHDISEGAQRLDAALRESSFLRSLIDALPQHICVLDDSGRIVSTNRAWDEFALGAGADVARVGVGASYREACVPAAQLSEVQAVLAGLDSVARGQQTRYRQRYSMQVDLEGGPRLHWFEVEIVALHPEGGSRLLLVSHEDISAHFDVLERLETSEQRFRELAECLPDTFFVYLPAQDRISYLSPGAARLPGALASCRPQRLHDIAEHLLPESSARWLDLLSAPGWYAASGLISLSVESRHGAAAVDLRFSPVREADGSIQRVVGLISDVSERHRHAERVTRVALVDELTELANRLALQQALSRRLQAEPQGATGLLLLNLDGMKAINDSLGHPAGDSLIAGCAQRLLTITPPGALLARMGGDEFAWLLPGCSGRHYIAELVERIVSQLREPFVLAGEEVVVGASSGCALFPGDAVDPVDLMRKADLALHAAKQEGRGRHICFGEGLGAPSAAVLRMKTDLARALEREEFELLYQPKYSIEPLRLSGVEALLRWRRRGERVSPAEFIPMLEEDGGIVAVGAWVLQAACQQAQRWRAAGAHDLSVAVNVSARQMQDSRILTDVVAALTASGLEPEALELEITESALMRDPTRVVGLTRELRALGVRIALDDFGTRYSSLNYLRQFAPQVLKIDKSFVDDIDSDATAAAMIEAIIQLGRSLDMQMVAEGVERVAQLQRLRHFGCDQVQGYLMMRPATAAELEPKLLGGHLPAL